MYSVNLKVYPKDVSKAYKFVIFLAIVSGVIALFAHVLHGVNIAVLNPQGQIASQEKGLIIFTVLLSLVIVVPVFTMLILIVWKYREGNSEAKYSPEWDHSRFFETLWWGIPCLVILSLGIVTWVSTHQLDPSKPISSSVKPINIQVVALQWKWLFIYPDEHIASVNSLEFPVNTPINFELTADAPMNSFWIPSLGGQIYAMPGMSTQLHLIADSTGNFNGSSANISGTGFSGMDFVAKSTTPQAYTNWTNSLRSSSVGLDDASYAALSKPSSNQLPSYYKLNDAYLYDKIVLKYMTPDDSFVGQK
jgi:cytochrome o ubiquinol oxidase subunit 2